MAKKHSVTRISTVYSETKASLGKYYKREFSTTKTTRIIVWDEGGYDLMVDNIEEIVILYF